MNYMYKGGQILSICTDFDDIFSPIEEFSLHTSATDVVSNFWCLYNGTCPLCGGDNYVYITCTHNYLLYKKENFHYLNTKTLLTTSVALV